MPKPNKGESEADFVDRCVPIVIEDGTAKDGDQAAAICHSMYADEKKALKRQPDPELYDDEDEFMEACMADGNDAETCQAIWNGEGEYMSADGKAIIRKTHASQSEGMDFILSDETPDRYEDVIRADGWMLDNFKKNPIALFGHNTSFPIGTWKDFRTEKGELRAKLNLAPEGTSPRIDEIRKLVKAGILKAVSVGFLPVEHKAREKSAGSVYIKSELIECSLVSIPANPNALAIARGLGVSGDVMKLVFAEHGNRGQVTHHRSAPASTPKRKVHQRNNQMNPTIAQRIKSTQERINGLRDKLGEHMKTVDDENPTEESNLVTKELTDQIEAQETSLNQLKRAESKLAIQTVDVNDEGGEERGIDGNGSAQGMVIKNRRPFAAPAKKVKPVDYLFRAATVKAKHFAMRGERTMVDVLKDTYGEDDCTHAMLGVVSRAATVPAITTLAGWAKDLVTTAIGEFFDLLQPVSVFGALANYGGRFEFGANGVVTMPTRLNTTNLGGAFVGESNPIPVKQGTFSSISMTPKKCGVISSFSREIGEHSTPAIEQLIRQAIIDDTAVSVDTKLLSADAATTAAPPGIKHASVGAVASAVSADATILGVIADVKAITNDVLGVTAGQIRNPVWLMSPATKLALGLVQAAAGGAFPFRDEIAGNRFQGWPVIVSNSVGDFLYLIDAADFVVASGAPRFDVSDQAVITYEDTAPADLAVAGALAAGSLTKSLWQTDTMAVRMIWDVTWAFRRVNMVRWITPVAWN